jgi:hypothetical protein
MIIKINLLKIKKDKEEKYHLRVFYLFYFELLINQIIFYLSFFSRIVFKSFGFFTLT